MPVGVPSDYRELLELYRPLLEAAATKRGLKVSEVVDELCKAKLIEGFDIESSILTVFSFEEAARFLGLSNAEWKAILKKTCSTRNRGVPWSFVRPHTDEGNFVQANNFDVGFWGPCILNISDFMFDHDVPRVRPESAKVVSAFRRRLGWFLSRVKEVQGSTVAVAAVSPLPVAPVVVAKPEASIVEWPKDLPSTYPELQKMYGTYIFDQVRRVSRIQTEAELEEVNQQVWLKIVESDVIGSFMEAARTKLPRTLTVNEVVGYLGITAVQWTNAVAYHLRKKSSWMPKPVKGTMFSKDALFLTEDIQTLDESGFLKDRRGEPRQHPEVTGRGFKSYLTAAVKNHFKNMLRTRSRRHKERVLDPKMALASDVSGMFHKVTTIEDAGSWEENLTDDTSMDVPMEDLIDLADRFREHGVDPNSEQGLEVIDLMTRGHTLRGAIKAQSRLNSRQKVTVGAYA